MRLGKLRRQPTMWESSAALSLEVEVEVGVAANHENDTCFGADLLVKYYPTC